jgi:hypothetical protein
MRKLRSALALVISVSMALLAPGGSAWAQVAQVTAGAAPVSAGGSAAAGSLNRGATAPTNLASALTLTTLAPVFSAPSAMTPAGPAPLTAAASAASAAMPAAAAPAAAPAVRAAETPAASAPIGASATPASSAEHAAVPANAPALAAAPAASALEGARREIPDFSKLSSGDSKGAAAADFLSRVGELFRPARALDSAPAAAAADGARGASAPALSRYQASPSNSPAVSPVERAPAARSARSAAAPLIAGAAAWALSGFTLAAPLLTFPLVVVSLVLHEIGRPPLTRAAPASTL